jgi:hypothetical protein
MSLFDDHSEVFHLGYRERAFLKLQVQMVVLEPLENLLRSFLVLSLPGRVDEQVVHINDEPPFSDKVAEEVVHECLEHGGGVAEAEEHDGGLEETKGSDECCLPVVLRSDQYIIISPAHVHLSENT